MIGPCIVRKNRIRCICNNVSNQELTGKENRGFFFGTDDRRTNFFTNVTQREGENTWKQVTSLDNGVKKSTVRKGMIIGVAQRGIEKLCLRIIDNYGRDDLSAAIRIRVMWFSF